MHVASLELCAELHELSGWNDKKELLQEIHHDTGAIVNTAYALPRYDLGYLLRKLPDISLTKALSNNTPVELGNYIIYPYPQNNFTPVSADTPEDAACALAIELWKQGVLK